MTVTIAEEPFDAPESEELLSELSAELHRRYGGDSEPGIKPTARDVAAFLVARGRDGRAIGCVGLRRLEDLTFEIKRMFVRPDERGRGVADRLLAAVEDRARALGAGRLVLETGVEQPESIAVYRRNGYRPIPRFGAYADSELSRCFGRDL